MSTKEESRTCKSLDRASDVGPFWRPFWPFDTGSGDCGECLVLPFKFAKTWATSEATSGWLKREKVWRRKVKRLRMGCDIPFGAMLRGHRLCALRKRNIRRG